MQNRRFVILAELGRGGHGRVFRARDEQLGRTLAIKVFHDSRDEAGRLMSEARTLCQLSHVGIVSVFDVSKITLSPGSQTTITLSEDESASDEPLTWAMLMEDLGDTDPLLYVMEHGINAALQIVAELADALAYAHSQGIFHCDVKRSNVRIVGGRAKLFDFSLAGRVSGRPYGTPAYRAPEQARGEAPTDRTDVYGLGRLLQELLNRNTQSQAVASGFSRRTRKTIDRLLGQMLDSEPRKRPSMHEVAEICRQCLRANFIKRPMLWMSAGLAVLIFGTFMAGGSWLPHRDQAESLSNASAADTFVVTVRVRAADGDAAWLRESASIQVVLDLDSDRRIATLDAAGEATFKGVPSRFLNQLVPLEVLAPGYVLEDGSVRRALSSEPLYVSIKREAVPTPARLRVAIGLVHQGAKVLMVRRRQREGSLMWQFPAGIVKPLQEPEQRVLDETLKETGISIKLLGKIGERISPDTRAHAIYYDCAYLGGKLNNGDPDENAEVAWVPASEVPSRVTSSLYGGVRDLLKGIQDGRTL